MSSYLEDFLDDFVCSNCFRYLSVMPVRVYPGKLRKCGRCVKDGDGGLDSDAIKLYETMNFPCVNRFEGCKKVLLPSKVKEHEKKCTSKKYKCPLCYNAEMPLYEMWQHFKSFHRENLLEKPAVSLNLSEKTDRTYFYRIAGFIFMWKIIVDDGRIQFKNQLIGPNEIGRKVEQQFRMSSILDGVGQFWKTTYKKDLFTNASLISCEVIIDENTLILKKEKTAFNGNGPESIYRRKLHLTDEFKKDYPALKLSPCGFFLLKGSHKFAGLCDLCGDCGKYVFDYGNSGTVCNFCKTYLDQRFNINNKINFDKIVYSSDDLFYYCKWDCKEKFNYREIFSHELYCINSPKITKCPVENCPAKPFINFGELKRHFKDHGGKFISFKMTDIFRLYNNAYYGFSNEFIVLYRVKDKNVYIIPNDNYNSRDFKQIEIDPTEGLDRLYNHPWPFNRIVDNTILRRIYSSISEPIDSELNRASTSRDSSDLPRKRSKHC
ncbi:unnamed protein product [Brassicogethes aeneus]|uniref:SIAH-type domain-containing protein n=1 Tax=Brassicogethes aeneus TaxID=1431903 RepID=A0A9P0FBL1_BRAAE|nr:unnamed protein product [Brassicogethes aeneus]